MFQNSVSAASVLEGIARWMIERNYINRIIVPNEGKNKNN
jgi:hypothetical protein